MPEITACSAAVWARPVLVAAIVLMAAGCAELPPRGGQSTADWPPAREEQAGGGGGM